MCSLGILVVENGLEIPSLPLPPEFGDYSLCSIRNQIQGFIHSRTISSWVNLVIFFNEFGHNGSILMGFLHIMHGYHPTPNPSYIQQ